MQKTLVFVDSSISTDRQNAVSSLVFQNAPFPYTVPELGTGEMIAQSIELAHKCEDLGLIPRTHVKHVSCDGMHL